MDTLHASVSQSVIAGANKARTSPFKFHRNYNHFKYIFLLLVLPANSFELTDLKFRLSSRDCQTRTMTDFEGNTFGERTLSLIHI